MRRLFLSLLVGALPLSAQAVIDPGMPKAQVVARLGTPAVERTTGDATFLFYTNECHRTCGMNDIVVFNKGVVVDAVFRSARRRYSGTSSSPRMIPAAEANRARPTRPDQQPDGPITIELKGRKPLAADR
jgi:outer membrane protein assembly factor BamE (lipoprotein component of BamABCDE complex)